MSQLTRAVDAGETGVDIVACAMDDDRIHGDEPITTGVVQHRVEELVGPAIARSVKYPSDNGSRCPVNLRQF